jgi:ABC-2 type transport system permease protein
MIAEYLGGLVVASVATSLVSLVVMVIVASLAFGLSFALYGVMLIPFVLVLFLFGLALGIVGSAIVLRLGPASEWFVWPIPALLAPFAAVYYPLDTLPVWMRAISLLLPPAYVFEGMRAVVHGQAFHAEELVAAFGLTIVYLVLAYWFFASVYRHAVRTGLIARYSAETVS